MSYPNIDSTDPVIGAEVANISSTDATPTLSPIARRLYVGVAGDVKVDLADGSTVTMPTMAGGVWHFVAVKKVYKVGTAATGLVFGY